MNLYVLCMPLLTRGRFVRNTDYYDDLDVIQQNRALGDIEPQDDKTYVRRSILQRLLEYAHDGTGLVSGKKQNEQYYSEIYGICGNNATCVEQLIETARLENGSANSQRYDHLISQMVTDVKTWLNMKHAEDPSRPHSKKKNPKRVRFQNTDRHEPKPTIVEEFNSYEAHTTSSSQKKSSQSTIWVMGIVFCIFVFLFRRLLQRALDGQLPISSHWLESRPIRCIREYLFV